MIEKQFGSLTPKTIIAMLIITAKVMFFRISVIGSYDDTNRGLWHSINAAILLAALFTFYPALAASPTLFVASVLIRLIGIILFLLIAHGMLKRVGKQDKFLVFSVPFIWIENMQQFLGGIIQNLMLLTGDFSIFLLILPIAIWSIYWLWRVARDIVFEGGFFAAVLVAISMIIDVGLLAVVQSMTGGIGG